jgi:hypothetical protein
MIVGRVLLLPLPAQEFVEAILGRAAAGGE